MTKTATADLPARVAVLEHSVQEVKNDLSGHRLESRQSLQEIQSALHSLVKSGAGQKTNWYAVMGFVAGGMAVVGFIFSLAEWRVGVALSPIVNLPRDVQELRIKLERDRAVQEYRERIQR
jgi:hypothetical protein